MAAPTENVRIKVDFQDFCGIANCFSDISWYLVEKSKLTFISDLQKDLVSSYLQNVTEETGKLHLTLDGCVVPDWASIDILRENDTVRFCYSKGKEKNRLENVKKKKKDKAKKRTHDEDKARKPKKSKKRKLEESPEERGKASSKKKKGHTELTSHSTSAAGGKTGGHKVSREDQASSSTESESDEEITNTQNIKGLSGNRVIYKADQSAFKQQSSHIFKKVEKIEEKKNEKVAQTDSSNSESDSDKGVSHKLKVMSGRKIESASQSGVKMTNTTSSTSSSDDSDSDVESQKLSKPLEPSVGRIVETQNNTTVKNDLSINRTGDKKSQKPVRNESTDSSSCSSSDSENDTRIDDKNTHLDKAKGLANQSIGDRNVAKVLPTQVNETVGHDMPEKMDTHQSGNVGEKVGQNGDDESGNVSGDISKDISQEDVEGKTKHRKKRRTRKRKRKGQGQNSMEARTPLAVGSKNVSFTLVDSDKKNIDSVAAIEDSSKSNETQGARNSHEWRQQKKAGKKFGQDLGWNNNQGQDSGSSLKHIKFGSDGEDSEDSEKGLMDDMQSRNNTFEIGTTKSMSTKSDPHPLPALGNISHSNVLVSSPNENLKQFDHRSNTKNMKNKALTSTPVMNSTWEGHGNPAGNPCENNGKQAQDMGSMACESNVIRSKCQLLSGAQVFTRTRNKKKGTFPLSKAQAISDQLTNKSYIFENTDDGDCVKKLKPTVEENGSAPDQCSSPVTEEPLVPVQSPEPDQPPVPARDYDRMPRLFGPPRIGDCIAYKILEMSENYCPEVSAFKEAKVTSFDPQTLMLGLELITKNEKRKPGRFDILVDDGSTVLTNLQTQVTTQVHFQSLMELRLVTDEKS